MLNALKKKTSKQELFKAVNNLNISNSGEIYRIFSFLIKNCYVEILKMKKKVLNFIM